GAEDVTWLPCEVLVKWRAGCDENANARRPSATCAPKALPHRSDGTWVAGADDGVELADIDSKFKRVGCDDADNFVVAEAFFDVAPVFRQIAPAVCHDARWIDRACDLVAQLAEHDFDAVS